MCRPLHHNAHAVENVLYMVDEVELAKLGSAPPPCDGESDLGGLLGMPILFTILLSLPWAQALCARIPTLGLCQAVCGGLDAYVMCHAAGGTPLILLICCAMLQELR